MKKAPKLNVVSFLLVVIGLVVGFYIEHHPVKPPTNQVKCADFPPVDGAGRPAVCDAK